MFAQFTKQLSTIVFGEEPEGGSAASAAPASTASEEGEDTGLVTEEDNMVGISIILKLQELERLLAAVKHGEKLLFAQEPKVNGLKYSVEPQEKKDAEVKVLNRMKDKLRARKDAVETAKKSATFLATEELPQVSQLLVHILFCL
jgi:hypothetical protein